MFTKIRMILQKILHPIVDWANRREGGGGGAGGKKKTKRGEGGGGSEGQNRTSYNKGMS